MIVGNKCDLPYEANAPAGAKEFRIVDESEGKNLAEQFEKEGAKASYIECSAKQDINIDQLFLQLLIQMKQHQVAKQKALDKANKKCEILWITYCYSSI